MVQIKILSYSFLFAQRLHYHNVSTKKDKRFAYLFFGPQNVSQPFPDFFLQFTLLLYFFKKVHTMFYFDFHLVLQKV